MFFLFDSELIYGRLLMLFFWNTIKPISANTPERNIHIVKLGVSWPVSRVLSWTIIHLDNTSPYTSSDLPGYSAGRTSRTPLKVIFCSIAALGNFLRSLCITHTLRFSKVTCLALKQNLTFRGALSIPIWSCSGRGLPCHKQLPVVRCALTAPFHPYQTD